DVFDVVSGARVQSLATGGSGPNGLQPGVLSYDASKKTLYATLSGINAIGVFAFSPTASDVLSPTGKIPSGWWPTSVRARADGSLVVSTGKGHGTGAATHQYGP